MLIKVLIDLRNIIYKDFILFIEIVIFYIPSLFLLFLALFFRNH